MSLFEEKKVTEVVTAKDIKDLTGISANDFNFVNEEDQEKALTSLLEKWIERIASHIYVRIDRTVSVEDGEFLAIQDVLVRTVANLVAIAQQQRSSPVIQIDSFAVNILNTSEVTKNLDNELKPFIRYKQGGTSGWVSIFSSLEEYEGEEK
jgi:hypothetical protein